MKQQVSASAERVRKTERFSDCDRIHLHPMSAMLTRPRGSDWSPVEWWHAEWWRVRIMLALLEMDFK